MTRTAGDYSANQMFRQSASIARNMDAADKPSQLSPSLRELIALLAETAVEQYLTEERQRTVSQKSRGDDGKRQDGREV